MEERKDRENGPILLFPVKEQVYVIPAFMYMSCFITCKYRMKLSVLFLKWTSRNEKKVCCGFGFDN